ncbi:hypothetical protein ERX46_10425 [Brumimicrobium glaciale]|jgi:hypothetical protein|uniref:Uncharacterized protein n=1 Tax=Brumimicrobium glaciale TaxID=200475 RepID=A0A4Q4KN57_9FLAO|nr:DUF6572 domain-containing protein [Brumimicrobium glaciale]RYM33349.1 hypothetical protein ERX46_10425 [Brumimicrobium glaciale]
MSIEQSDKIDFISTSKSGTIQLTISDHLEWKDEEMHLLILQKKINAYLDFIQSEQIFEDYPSAKNKKITISLSMKFKPTNVALKTLEDFKMILTKQDFEFSWKVIK